MDSRSSRKYNVPCFQVHYEAFPASSESKRGKREPRRYIREFVRLKALYAYEICIDLFKHVFFTLKCRWITTALLVSRLSLERPIYKSLSVNAYRYVLK